MLENEGVMGLNLFGTGNPSRAKKTNPTVPFTDTQLDKLFTCNRPNIYSMTSGSVVVFQQKRSEQQHFRRYHAQKEPGHVEIYPISGPAGVGKKKSGFSVDDIRRQCPPARRRDELHRTRE